MQPHSPAITPLPKDWRRRPDLVPKGGGAAYQRIVDGLRVIVQDGDGGARSVYAGFPSGTHPPTERDLATVARIFVGTSRDVAECVALPVARGYPPLVRFTARTRRTYVASPAEAKTA